MTLVDRLLHTNNRARATFAPVPNTTFWRAMGGFYVPRTSDPFGEQWVKREPGETFVTHVFATVLGNGSMCSTTTERRPLVVDVGANEGYYGLMSAAWGCDVEMYEPQPRCASLIREAVRHNGFDSRRARVIPQPVSASAFNLTVTNAPFCLGGFPFHKSTRRSTKSQEGPSADSGLGVHFGKVGTHTVPSISLSSKFGRRAHQQRIALVKIDVEGKELSILRDLQPLMSAGLVNDVIVEVTPGWWAHDTDAWEITWLAMERMGFVAHAHFDTDRTLTGHAHKDFRKMIETIRARSKIRARAQANIWLRRRHSAGLHSKTLSALS